MLDTIPLICLIFQSPIGMGIYDVFISDWMEVLGREKFFIIQSEELEACPRKTLPQIFDFLDLGKFLKSLELFFEMNLVRNIDCWSYKGLLN